MFFTYTFRLIVIMIRGGYKLDRIWGFKAIKKYKQSFFLNLD